MWVQIQATRMFIFECFDLITPMTVSMKCGEWNILTLQKLSI